MSVARAYGLPFRLPQVMLVDREEQLWGLGPPYVILTPDGPLFTRCLDCFRMAISTGMWELFASRRP